MGISDKKEAVLAQKSEAAFLLFFNEDVGHLNALSLVVRPAEGCVGRDKIQMERSPAGGVPPLAVVGHAAIC